MTTQLLVTSTPAERILAAAAAEAGLLETPARRFSISSSADADAAAAELGHDDDVELVVGTGTLAVGRELTRRFRDAPVSLLAAGASAYGPTFAALQGRLAKRVRQVLHVDLVPGLDPVLLAERSVPVRTVPPEHVRTAAASLPGLDPVSDPTTLVLGRSAPWVGALDRDAQTALLVAMVERCSEAGHTRIVLLLDKDAPARARKQLDKAARAARADLTIVTGHKPVEAWFALDGVGLVVGSADEDLLVARSVFGHRVAQLDTEVVVKNLRPFDDPRRAGATLVGATVPDLRSWTSTPGGDDPRPVDLTGLMGTVAYAMQPDLLVDRRAAAIGFLEVHPDVRRRFVRKRR
ncbi:MAG: hypothetical protein ACRYG2_07355, partial [Janthinobacterium lividum]